MSKKDYIAIAAIIRKAREQEADSIDHIEDSLIQLFAADNPRFDVEQFRNATASEE